MFVNPALSDASPTDRGLDAEGNPFLLSWVNSFISLHMPLSRHIPLLNILVGLASASTLLRMEGRYQLMPVYLVALSQETLSSNYNQPTGC